MFINDFALISDKFNAAVKYFRLTLGQLKDSFTRKNQVYPVVILKLISGVGLYLAASVLDHSCQPTANVVFLGKDLIVRSIQDNGNDDFSAVRISYTNLLNTNQGRKKDLMVS